jgi:hypothetical protein
MDKINNSGKWLIGIVIGMVVIVIVLLILFSRHQNNNSAQAPNNTSTPQTSIASSTATNTQPLTTPSQPPISAVSNPASNSSQSLPPPPPPVIIHLLTPTANDQWAIGQQNSISWDNYPGITGQIVLLNASNKSVVGVITSETEPHQTSYIWNTQSYNLGRYGGLMKDAVPGTYLIEVEFDGNNLPPLIGGPVIITN